jgi:hypothetical protein
MALLSVKANGRAAARAEAVYTYLSFVTPLGTKNDSSRHDLEYCALISLSSPFF